MRFDDAIGATLFSFFLCVPIGVNVYTFGDSESSRTLYWALVLLIALALILLFVVAAKDSLRSAKMDQEAYQQNKIDLKKALVYLHGADPSAFDKLLGIIFPRESQPAVARWPDIDDAINSITPKRASAAMRVTHAVIKSHIVGQRQKSEQQLQNA